MKSWTATNGCIAFIFACVCAGCSTAVGSGGIVLPRDELRAHPRVAAYLRAKGIAVLDAASPALAIRNGDPAERRMSRYIDILRLQYAIVQANLANAQTIADETMKNRPYRRRVVIMGSDGEFDVCTDDAPLPRRYAPAHPLADDAGFVLMTNVDVASEEVERSRIVDDYQFVCAVLKRLDPGRNVKAVDAAGTEQR